MLRRWQGLAAPERALIGGISLLVTAILVLVAIEQPGTFVWLLVFAALLPLFVAGLITVYAELELRRKLLARRVRRAIELGELVVHYQPLVNLRDRSVASVEALVRWQSEGKLVPPAAFLPAIRNTRLAAQLDLHVVDLALAQAAAWAREGHQLTVSVNFHPDGLLDPALTHAIGEALTTHGVPPERLEIEVTELAFNGGPDLQHALERLKVLGVGIVLDDFGIGDSSLARLSRLPVDRMKIDRSFVAEMLADRRADSVVRASIDIAHDVGVDVVGEGVETRQMLNRLTALGCDLAQGFLFSPPVPADTLAERVVAGQVLSDNGDGRPRAAAP